MKTNSRVKRISRSIIVTMISICLITGLAAAAEPAFAASSFSTKAPFSGTRSSYTHNSRFAGNLIVNGVDVSAWQSKNCNWTKAKARGVDYAIMRISYTNYGPRKLKLNNDGNFSSMYSKAKKSGMMIGCYVFSQAKNATEAKQEAKFAVKRLKALGIGPDDLALPVYMDYEFAGGYLGRLHGVSRKNATNAAVAFCNTIKSYGYTPGVYANLTFFNKQLDTSRFASDVDLWCAQYYKRCESSVRYSKWQYSSSAKIDGVYYFTGARGSTDVNFWYLNKKSAKKPITKIYGRTTLSVKDAKAPKFKIYKGKTLLREGKDYVVGGIRNAAKGKGYAYIKGIGAYGGYALIPITVASKSKGKASDAVANSKCANYLTYATGAKSKYVSSGSSSSSSSAKSIKYKVGKTYTLKDYMNVRKGPGTSYAKVKRSALGPKLKAISMSGTNAVLKKGAKVTCKQIKGNWMRVADGKWICCKEGGTIYVK